VAQATGIAIFTMIRPGWGGGKWAKVWTRQSSAPPGLVAF